MPAPPPLLRRCSGRKSAKARSSRDAGWTALALSLSACSAEAAPRALTWKLSFQTPEIRTRTEQVEVTITRGGCAGSEVLYQEAVTRDGKVAKPPTLGPGSYALQGRALASGCREIAHGCIEIKLPTKDGSAYEIELAPAAERQVCDGICDTEPCVTDAGADASTDAAADAADAAAGDAARADASGDASAACEDGVVAATGHCYRFVAAPRRDWHAAEADCVTWGGHLVSLNDPEEEHWVAEQAALATDFELPVAYWLGFTDEEVETLWRWSDGSEQSDAAIVVYDLADPAETRFKVPSLVPTYTHWGARPAASGNAEPNNGDAAHPTAMPGEDCAQAIGARMSGPDGIQPRPEWNDVPCGATLQYVCER